MKIGVLFDLDGTLLDTLQDLTNATNYALAQYGYPGRSLAQVRSFVGNGAGELIRRATDGGADWPEVLQSFRQFYASHCREKTAPYPGILAALEQLKGRYPLAIVSNKPDEAVKRLCRDFFPGVYAQGECPGCPRKPAPDMLLAAMRAIGTQECIYVGDSEVDIQTACSAQAPCLSVLWGFRDRRQLAEAAWFCENPADLPEMIEKIAGECYGK